MIKDSFIGMTEDYVSFEIAKLLKKGSFNVYVGSFYDDTGLYYDGALWDWNGSKFRYSRPTHQMAMKWLREEKHIYIQIMLDTWSYGDHSEYYKEYSGYYVVIQKTDSDFEMMLSEAVNKLSYQTYEEACEAAIKYCLENLI